MTYGSNATSAILRLSAVGLIISAFSTDVAAQIGVRVNPAQLTGAVNQSLNAVNNQVFRGLNQLSSSVNRGLGQVNASVNRSLNTINSYGYRPPVQVRYPSYRTSYRPTNLSNRASSAARSSYYSPQTMTQPQVQQRKPIQLSKEQKAALREQQAAMAKSQTGMGILPAESLARLNDMQTGLQNAASSRRPRRANR